MASKPRHGQLTVPALRGFLGDWIYYSCLMPIREVGARTEYAHIIHPARDDELSKMIQRVLEGRRAREISDYLHDNDERFFNAMVLAVYGGSPDWLEIGIRGSETPRAKLDELSEQTQNSVGFLRFSGHETLFAIDGQHRLSGIREAMQKDSPLGDELLPVIFVGHSNTTKGMRRTRRLFTTLNKTAVPVNKRDIIALDEDDVMAITARDLYENDKRFSKPRIAMIATNSLPATSPALTTIGNLYDILKALFLHQTGSTRDSNLRFNRPSDKRLLEHRNFAERYFAALAQAFPPLASYYAASDPAKVARKHRSSKGGHILFRPIGLDLLTRAIVTFARERKISIEKAIKVVAKVETDLTKPPYLDVIWNAEKGIVLTRGKTIARRLVFYSLRLPCNEATLLADYRAFVGLPPTDKSLTLPKRLFPPKLMLRVRRSGARG
jgi:DNA sulfur modification protein DndB